MVKKISQIVIQFLAIQQFQNSPREIDLPFLIPNFDVCTSISNEEK
jgi:hypothetical protein